MGKFVVAIMAPVLAARKNEFRLTIQLGGGRGLQKKGPNLFVTRRRRRLQRGRVV